MTRQRRHGLSITVWPTHEVTDSRGNVRRVINRDVEPHERKAWIIPQRSARAELVGQAQINVIRIGVDAHLDNVDLYSRVEYDGHEWDVVSPPAYHHGTRHTRHWSIDLRQRP